MTLLYRLRYDEGKETYAFEQDIIRSNKEHLFNGYSPLTSKGGVISKEIFTIDVMGVEGGCIAVSTVVAFAVTWLTRLAPFATFSTTMCKCKHAGCDAAIVQITSQPLARPPLPPSLPYGVCGPRAHPCAHGCQPQMRRW